MNSSIWTHAPFAIIAAVEKRAENKSHLQTKRNGKLAKLNEENLLCYIIIFLIIYALIWTVYLRCACVQVVGKKLRNCTAFNNIVAVEVFEICERDFIKCRFRLLNKSFKQRKHFMFCLDLNRVATFVFAPFGPLCVVVALPKLNRMRTMEKIEFNFRIVVHNIARSISGLILRSCRRRAGRRRYIMRTPSAIYIRQKRSGTQRSPI